jgi:hypothetical protein
MGSDLGGKQLSQGVQEGQQLGRQPCCRGSWHWATLTHWPSLGALPDPFIPQTRQIPGSGTVNGWHSPATDAEKSAFLRNMAVGRKLRAPLEALRTRWWYQAVARAVACKDRDESPTAYRVTQVFKGKDAWKSKPTPQWYNYQEGTRSPSESVLKVVEQAFPGTRRVFERGPDFSFLWEALAGDPRQAVSQTEELWRNGVRVGHLIRIPESTTANEKGEFVRVPAHDGQQEVVLPAELAHRCAIEVGARLNVGEKLQAWERLQDLCGQEEYLELQDQVAFFTAGVLLSCAPSATATKAERAKAYPYIRLPYFAGLAYVIARARLEGRNELRLPEWDFRAVRLEAGKTWEQHPAEVRAGVEQYLKMWEDFGRVSGMRFDVQLAVAISVVKGDEDPGPDQEQIST